MPSFHTSVLSGHNVFGYWVSLEYLLSPFKVTIDAAPVGPPDITGQVHYYDERGAVREPTFLDHIEFVTGNYAHNLKVRFKGIPAATAVNVSVRLEGVPSAKTDVSVDGIISLPVSRWTSDDVNTVMLDRLFRSASDPKKERLADLERQWFRLARGSDGS